MSKQTFESLLGQYWDLAHFQGNSGVSQGDKANEVLNALKVLAKKPAQRKPLTDKMVLIAARVMSDRQADACNVDKEDQWKVYGEDFIDDARAMLEAAHGVKEKNT